MKILFHLILIAFISIGCAMPVVAQNPSSPLLNKANKLFQNKAYSDAIPVYQYYLQKDGTNPDALINIAACYRLLNDMIQAEKWYKKVVVLNNCPTIYYLYFGEVLMANGKYAQAKVWLEEYIKKDGSDIRGKAHLETIKRLDEYFFNSNHCIVKKVNINSNRDDFYPIIYKNGIIFMSSRKQNPFVKYRNAWTGGNFLSFYFAKNKDSITFSKPKLFASSLQNKYNNGPLTLNKDFTTLYFNSNNAEIQNNEGAINLGIYESHILPDGKNWDKHIIPFRWNSNTYNCAHPCLSPDGNMLFFASDMKLGYGGMDIYVCKKDGNVWGEPENLGPEINTKGNEVFPYMNEKGVLYFSSNSHDGLGGLDIFYCYPLGTSFSKPQNVGAPINSNSDDFGITFSAINSGYFSSNRGNEGSDDDIYWFSFDSPKKIKIKIKIIDSLTSMQVINPTVSIKSTLSQEKIALNPINNTQLSADLVIGSNYIIDVQAETFNQKVITENIVNNTMEIKILLSKKSEKNEDFNLKEISGGKAIKIDNLYFEASRWDTPFDAKKSLDKIVTLMIENPALVIELSSHTDCRGVAAANFDLSNKRAFALKEYIVNKGVDSRRVFSSGYGATIPVNKCDCEERGITPCTEKQYQENNRSEFKVIGFFRNGIISDK